MDQNNSINSGLIGSLIVAIFGFTAILYQENLKMDMERIQFESNLILNSIDNENIESSKKNIRFLIEAGLISRENQKIITLLTDTTFVYILPKRDTLRLKPTYGVEISMVGKVISGRIVNENGEPIENAKVFINPCFKDNKPTNCNSFCKSDKFGLFELPIGDYKNFRFLIYKEGYRQIYKRYLNNKGIKFPEKFILEME